MANFEINVYADYKQWLFKGHMNDSKNARERYLKELGIPIYEYSDYMELIQYGYDHPEESDAMKFDKDKLKWSLLPLDCIKEAVKRFTLGAKKYSPDNWKKVNPDQYYDALMRHLSAWKEGEDLDDDAVLNGETLTHLSAVLWNAIVLVWFDLQKKRKLRLETKTAIQELQDERKK